MEKAFLIKKVQCYDISGKSVLQTQEKFYAADTGLHTLKTNTVQYQDTFYPGVVSSFRKERYCCAVIRLCQSDNETACKAGCVILNIVILLHYVSL